MGSFNSRLVVALVGFVSVPALAQNTAAPADDDVTEVIVSGFRSSLEAALLVKRESVSAVDAIVAEDIAKFPDQNLAESLQRIPGIAIQRDGGEGRAITVRGLGSQFTRVRVNGMESVATSSDGASANRDRGFDFNVFASELFSSLVVHKTAEASLDEGSLGAVVDLNTGNPLQGKIGWTAVASAQGSYNTLNEDWGPRVAGLLSWKSDAGNLGASISAAYSQADAPELGNNTVRWAQARFDSVAGTPCFTTQNTGGTYIPSAACDAVSLSFHPRIPRYDVIGHDRERLGVTASLQWMPTERTQLSLDGLFSRYSEIRTELTGEVLFRTLERPVDVVNYTIDADNNLISGTFNDVPVRTENYLRDLTTTFHQVGFSVKQELTDTLRVNLLAGVSESDADITRETTLIFDDRDAQGYRYDYTNMQTPVLTFGTSVTTPGNFQLSEIRDRPSNTTNNFRTLSLGAEWDATENLSFKGGGVYRRFGFDLTQASRDTVVCGNGGVDRIFGTLNCSASTAFGPTAIYGFPVTANLATLLNIGKSGQPAGTTESWLIPNLETAAAFTNLYSRTLVPDTGNIRGVREKVTGGYLELNAKGDVFSLPYRANVGTRFVKTDQRSNGINSNVVVEVERTYNDWLPALNLALYPRDNLIIRAAASKVITRPNLGNLTPGGSVDGFNFVVNFGNPQLAAYRAKAYDLSLEWYFAPQAIASVALFKKDVSSFPIAISTTGTFASTGLPLSTILASSPAASNPEGQPWTIRSFGEGTGATLNGVEVALQTPFTFLPGMFKDFGVILNATFVDSDADYIVSGPATVPNGALPTSTLTSTLFNLSKNAYNATLYYENVKFSARVSGSYRGKYIDAASGTGNIFEGYNSSINIDASLRYKFTDQLEFSLEGVNLTDEFRDRFTDLNANRNYEYNHFGRTLLVGARYKM